MGRNTNISGRGQSSPQRCHKGLVCFLSAQLGYANRMHHSQNGCWVQPQGFHSHPYVQTAACASTYGQVYTGAVLPELGTDYSEQRDWWSSPRSASGFQNICSQPPRGSER